MMIKQCGNGTWDDCTTVSLNVKSVHGLRGPEQGGGAQRPPCCSPATSPPHNLAWAPQVLSVCSGSSDNTRSKGAGVLDSVAA